MKKTFSIAVAALLIGGLSAAPASAKKRHRQIHSPSQMTTGSAPMLRGNNAELMGNNGNSGQGDNSLGHIKGGNVGGGK